MFDDDFDDLVVRAAANVDDIRPATDLHDTEQCNSNTKHEDEADLELALKLSVEFNNAVAALPSHRSPVNLNRSSVLDVVEFDKDEDFEFAVKLSQELNDQGPLTSRESSNNSSSNIVTLDEDDDYKLASKLSEELNKDLQNSDLKSTSRGGPNSASSVVTVDEDKDFELALKLSMELNNSPIDVPSSSRSTSSVPFDYNRDFELALKLSAELNSDSLNKGASSITPEKGLHSEAKSDSNIPIYDVENSRKLPPLTPENEDLIVDKVVRDIIASQGKKPSIRSPIKSRRRAENDGTVKKYLSENISIVDPSWETIDPNPDIHAMFVAFNKRFFYGELGMVEVRWSPRMTLCAGSCTYKQKAGHCIVNLSKPLLQLRPRKDLVETLLHEMIHAYLFVTRNDRDRDGHGGPFLEHMNRINRESGARITVYHSFHDEVRYYKQHEWRCIGPCRDNPPFYGFVRRSMNRAPGPHDHWWSDHAARCGGVYVKTKEPEGYANKKVASESRNALGVENKGSTYNIENYFKTTSAKTSKSPAPGPSSTQSTFFPVLTSASTNVAVSAPSTGSRIFTINDLSNNKNATASSQSQSTSPKKWVPLPGRGNIHHFVNKS